MKDGGFSSTAASIIYQDINVQATSFDKISYIFCPRESNSVAHVLAKEAGDQPRLWVDDPPNFIIQCLIDDVTII